MNWVQLLNKIFVIVLLCNSLIIDSLSLDNNDFSSYEAKYLPNCDYENNDLKNYFIAITLNGKINIIDAVLGRIKWSKQIQSDPLISSNIGDVMKIRNSNGESIQILPSLDGNLYVYQEDQIKKTQFSAEKLLKSSFKFNENILLVGGQESKIIGLNLNSGDLIYDCGHAGCSNENYSTDGDIVLLRKNSQSVRAINTMTGQEEWHFVVDDPQVIKVSNQECSSNSTSPYSITFKVMLPTGQITSLVHYSNDSLQSEIFNSWNLILDSPIVNMWHLINDDLTKINLFDPNINSFETLIPKNSVQHSYFYLGSFNNNFYIQTAEDQTNENQLIPYINNDSKDKTNVIKQDFIPLQTKQSNLQAENSNTQLMIGGGNFPFMKYENINATGYLVLQNKLNHNDFDGKCSSTDVAPEYTSESVYVITEIVYISITYYWKEILCLCLIFSAAINTLWCLIRKWFSNLFKKGTTINNCNRSCFDEDNNTIEASIIDNRSNEQNENQHQQQNYTSRFLEDFEPLSLLGKGGFGMVFEAKHKIDESHYAVKRIRIPTNEEKRLRFTREIRALSKLDHVNIVRYYNAWLEEPPMGWQEKQDKLKNFELTSTFDETTYTSKSQAIEKLESQTEDSLEIVFQETSNEQIKLVSTKNGTSLLKNVSNTTASDYDDENIANNFIESDHFPSKTYSDKNKSNCLSIPKAYMYIQMQLCKKETLKDWLQQNLQRNNQHVIDIFVQILKAVNYVHSNNLIHRDLKPSNIFFSMDGLIKIGDFGLVTTDNKHDLDNKNDQDSSRLLSNNNFKHTNRVGTQLYMSPEQIKNRPYDHKVDIYSMGIILYELLIPFRTESERIIQLQNARIKKFSDILLKKYSKEKTIIEKMMSESPKDRPESHDILAYDLFCAN